MGVDPDLVRGAIELETIPTERVYVGAPPRPDGVYDLVVDGRLTALGSVTGGRALHIDVTTGGFELVEGEPGRVGFDGLPAGSKDVEIWLPHDETTELVDLRAGRRGGRGRGAGQPRVRRQRPARP